MNESSNAPVPEPAPTSTATVAARSSWKRKALIITSIVLGTAVISVAGTSWWVKRNVFASAFQPVQLSSSEKGVLDGKLQALQQSAEAQAAKLDPELERRTLTLSEREINGWLASQRRFAS